MERRWTAGGERTGLHFGSESIVYQSEPGWDLGQRLPVGGSLPYGSNQHSLLERAQEFRRSRFAARVIIVAIIGAKYYI